MAPSSFPRFVALVLGAHAAPLVGQAAGDLDRPLPVDPEVTVGRLENGLRYLIRVNGRPEKRAELRLVVNAGSVLEDDDQRGLAHFVEHMAFNGTEHFARQELVSYLESVGMRLGPHLNAYTSFDETVYMLRIPTDSAEVVAKAFQILEDWAHLVAFEAEEIEKERGVVIEEWRLGRGAQARIRDQQLPVVFRGSRYADRLPIGTRGSLEGFGHETLRRFYRDWYRPDLMAVVAVGDFDAAGIERLIRTHFSRIPAHGAAGGGAGAEARPREVFEVPDHEETLVTIATDAEATNSSVGVYYKHPLRSQETVGAFRQQLVERLYNGMLNARLFELTQRPEAPFLFGSSGQGRFVRSKEVYALFAGVKDGGMERGLEALLIEAERVARHGFTPTELEREKTDLLRGLERAHSEREKRESGSYASEYVRHVLVAEPIPGIETEYELARRLVPTIDVEEVNRLARAWITDQNRVIVASAPDKADVPVPTEGDLLAVFDAVIGKEIAPYEDEASDAPLVARLPEPAPIVAENRIAEIDVTIWTLGNGVRVLLKPTDFKDDEILLRSYSPGGHSLAPDEAFVTSMMADDVVEQGGVGELSLIELRKTLTGKAVSVSPYIGSLTEGISGSGSPKDVETLFQLVYLYFTSPRKDSAAFIARRQQMEGFLANRSANPMAAFQDTVQVTMAQGHPRARPLTTELLDELDLERSFAFYRDRFADASDFTFVIVGSFTVDSIRPLVQRYLGGLPSIGREERWRDVGIDPPRGVVEKAVYRGIEPRSQTQIIFTGPFEYTAEQRYAMRSLADVLRIRLRESLREELGATYGVGVSGSYGRDPVPEYSFSVSFGSAPERVEEMVGVVFQEIEALKADGPRAEDLEKVREAQRRAKETNLEENGYWAAQLLSSDQYGLDPRRLPSYEELEWLEAELIGDAARRYLATNNYVRVSLYPEKAMP